MSDCAGHSRNMGSSHVSAACVTYHSEDPSLSFSDRDSGQAKPEGCMDHACSFPLMLSKWYLCVRKISQGCNAARFTDRVISLKSVSVTPRRTVPAKTPQSFPYLGRDGVQKSTASHFSGSASSDGAKTRIGGFEWGVSARGLLDREMGQSLWTLAANLGSGSRQVVYYKATLLPTLIVFLFT